VTTGKYLEILKITTIVLFCAWVLGVIFSFGISKYASVDKEYIQFRVNERKSSYVQKGWLIWLKQGVMGYKNAAMEKFSFAGKILKSSKKFETGILKNPEEAYLIRGALDKKCPINVPQVTYMHDVFPMEATGYDPYPDSGQLDWAGTTFLGWRARYGIAAVDPRVIPLRSLIYVDGYGFAWAGDTGGDIKGKRIDLCYNNTEDALRWGRRKVKVYVLGKKPAVKHK
jgi:3D (Asp-Asp-Asp) domain-containing protein